MAAKPVSKIEPFSLYGLFADVALSKTFTADGVDAYPNAYNFISEEYTVRSIDDFYKAMCAVASERGCLIKGVLNRELHHESRAGATDAMADTRWMCFDIDKSSRFKTPEQFMAAFGMDDVSYIVQYSSSYGIERDGKPYDERLSCHIFVLLDRGVSAPMLKQYLYGLNFTSGLLNCDLELTKSACALRYPLDVTTCQNDKLLYIAAPELTGGWKDTLGDARIKVVKGKRPCLEADMAPMPAEAIKKMQADRINALRIAAGIEPRKKYDMKYVDDIEVLAKPDQATVSGMKTERGFVYLNLNGGNSWGYFHPVDNYEFIRNFKGEPTYLTKELLPDYYAQCRSQARIERARADTEAARGQGTYYMAFREFKTGAYYNGTWDGRELELAQAKGREQLRDFLAQYNRELGDVVPDWKVFFDPTDPVRVDVKGKQVNLYVPPDITPVAGEFPTVERVIKHVLNTSEGDGLYEHFINWLAHLVVARRPAGTAWVFQGTQGTGKGVLFEHVITPLVGYKQATLKLMDELEGSYNGWMEHTIACMVDEVQIGSLAKARTVSAKLKSWITEPQISVNEKYRNTKNVNSYMNWIFASNMPDPVLIEEGDRRFNVGNYQPTKIGLTAGDIDSIAEELPAFLAFLQAFPIDYTRVRTVLKTVARDELIEMNRTAVDVAIDAIKRGDLGWLESQLPTDDSILPITQQFKADGYRAVLERWKKDAVEGVKNVTRDQLQAVLQYVVGDLPESPNKFTSYLKHRRVVMGKVWYDDKAQVGLKVEWKVDTKPAEPAAGKTKAKPRGR